MNEAIAALQSAKKVVITSHIQPDGDAVGSTVALLRALKKMGKECRAISPSHIPSGEWRWEPSSWSLSRST